MRILDLKNIDLQKKLDLMKYEIFRVGTLNALYFIASREVAAHVSFALISYSLPEMLIPFLQKQDRILQITNIMEDILMETDQDIVKRYAAPIQKVSALISRYIYLPIYLHICVICSCAITYFH